MKQKTGKLAAGILCLLSVLFLAACKNGEEEKKSYPTDAYRKKIDLIKAEVLTDIIRTETGVNPAGKAGYAVFISVCDTKQRASVLCGTGDSLDAAWEAADSRTEEYLSGNGLAPEWVKADVVYISREISTEELNKAIKNSRPEFFRYGVAFDSEFNTALLEAELNGAKIFKYDEGGFDLEYLNEYLEEMGREPLEEIPQTAAIFQCFGWICDSDSAVYNLYADGLRYGRRRVDLIDAACAEQVITTSMEFLEAQMKEDGSFVYGMYPRFDNEIDDYNIVRHASAIWSMVCRYRMTGEEELAQKIELAIDYLISNIRHSDENTAHVYELKDDEIKLGGTGLAVIAMTEYMDAAGNTKYEETCRELGNGILSMLDMETGKYYHVLNGDFSRKEEFRTIYYDGEATFALCQLYKLTGDEIWLEAAKRAVDNFIAGDYAQYKDHWIAYSMNAITRYVDDARYVTFALQCVQKNLETIYRRDTTYHTYLELLMASFELYDRILAEGIPQDAFPTLLSFDRQMFLKTIYARADRQLNGYFYPEYAMYMKNPQRVAGTFMVRQDGYRIRIDDVQHNVGGYYLYWKNYDKLVEHGMLDCRDK